MNISDFINNLESARKKYGNLKVAIVGQDSGGVYPGDYVNNPIAFYFDKEEADGIFIVTIDTSRITSNSEMDSISDVIENAKKALKKYGNHRIEISYMDSGGTYDEHSEGGVEIYHESKGKQQFFSIG